MHKKLLILVILLFFSCNLSKSEQNNQISALDTEKIKEYQKNESQTNIQFPNEIKAFESLVVIVVLLLKTQMPLLI